MCSHYRQHQLLSWHRTPVVLISADLTSNLIICYNSLAETLTYILTSLFFIIFPKRLIFSIKKETVPKQKVPHSQRLCIFNQYQCRIIKILIKIVNEWMRSYSPIYLVLNFSPSDIINSYEKITVCWNHFELSRSFYKKKIQILKHFKFILCSSQMLLI
jgi:hypothetical protein